jgi:hypothetical protein
MGRRRKWISAPRLDDEIRRCYAARLIGRKLPGLIALAEKTGWPRFALIQRARKLDLCYIKEKPWSEPELRILRCLSWMSDARISLHLSRRGFRRSATAVHLKLKRMRFKNEGDWFTLRGLASALGIDAHAVMGWIERGWLRAARRGTARTEKQGGDMWAIHESWIRRFVREHPTEVDLRKVDQVWFLDMIFNGKGERQ